MNRTIAILALLLACCGSRREEANPNMSTPTAAADVTITSSAFTHGGTLPTRYGCSGQSLSPPLSFAGVPKGAKSLALIVTDPDAPSGTFTHWVAWNIPPDTKEIAEGHAAPGSEGTSDFGKRGYGGPCPPSGSHRYFFHLYALDTTLDLAADSERADVERAMNGHVLAKGELMGTYRR
jgi:Raf kinase inhibitor-like YbhB/YbcL family protein